MTWIEALILGIIQGLTEFLPVSSSGHLELGKALLGIEAKESLMFSVAVHGATVLSTIIVFRKEILHLLEGIFKFRYNEETQYALKIVISMVPVGIIGVLFKDTIKGLFTGNVLLVGAMLLVTALLLAFTYYAKEREKSPSYGHAFLMGMAQAIAVLPGISRSGATISTGLLLGNRRDEVAQFSFLMVLLPIIGENFLDLISGEMAASSVGTTPLIIGSLAAFITGLVACTWMLKLVKKGKLIWFALYCALVGGAAIIAHFFI
ncbi:MAG: UDP-diphosphatase [Bacteroidetes bacterium]|nr:MAG: UDP-diphosphatase [Bacteroidota bacterium]